MGIVRGDKRPEVKGQFQEVRYQLEEALRLIDGLQATVDEMELALGLTSEGAQEKRSALCVLHFPAGSEQGHTLDQCGEDCAVDDFPTCEEAEEEPKETNQD